MKSHSDSSRSRFADNWWHRARRRVRHLLLSATLYWTLEAPVAQAQGEIPPPPPAPVVTVSRSWYFEAVIVVAMIGLALFVVCRSSRRN